MAAARADRLRGPQGRLIVTGLRRAGGPARLDPALIVWALAALIYLALLPFGVLPFDTDAMLRLEQVRDLFAGQSWWDVTQYRMNPPEGAAMHWSRLVDLPLLASLGLFSLLLPMEQAEYAMLIIVPLLYLGVALALLQAIMRRLGIAERALLPGLGLALLFPLLPKSFAPYQIDHHVPQTVAAVAGAYFLLLAPRRSAAIGGGVAAAIWLNISLEGLPVVALFAALYGLRYLLVGDRSLALYLAALAIAAPLLSLATRPVSEFALWCDILLPAHFAAFALAALWAAILPRLPRQDSVSGRLVALAIIAPLAGGAYAGLLGQCGANPFAEFDPVLREFWYDRVLEGRPIWVQPLHIAGMMAGLAIPVAVALFVLLRPGGLPATARFRWAIYGALVAGCTGYGLLLLREMLVAQLLAVPLLLAVLIRLLAGIREMRVMPLRVIASVAALLLLTPAGWAQLGRAGEALFPESGLGTVAVATNLSLVERSASCNHKALDRLPKGHVFTTFDTATIFLAQTQHSVEMGGYHRNQAGLREVIDMYIAPPEQADAILRANATDYVAVCLDDASLYSFAEGRPASVAALILRGQTPGWLVPIDGFEADGMRVYRVE